MALAAVVPALVAMSVDWAYAGTSQSYINTVTIGTRTFYNYSYIDSTTGQRPIAYVVGGDQAGQTIATGDVEGEASLYATSTGTLCSSTTYIKSQKPGPHSYFYAQLLPGACLGAHLFYVSGSTGFSTYGNGQPYTILGAYATSSEPGSLAAVASPSSGSTAPYAYPRNASGQTYGSQLKASPGQSGPDLVQAEGQHGVMGYVRASDLLFGSQGLSAQQLAALKNAPHVIPLVAQDGKTVLGEFDMPLGVVQTAAS